MKRDDKRTDVLTKHCFDQLKLSDFNINQIQLTVTEKNGPVSATGYLTSLEPESSIPESSTIAIFSLLGACSLIYHHARRRGIDPRDV